jgi:isopenicillin N synthase-like dioxygenase
MPRGAKRAARQPNCMEFSGQKEIPDSVKSRKEKFFKYSQDAALVPLRLMRYIGNTLKMNKSKVKSVTNK